MEAMFDRMDAIGKESWALRSNAPSATITSTIP